MYTVGTHEYSITIQLSEILVLCVVEFHRIFLKILAQLQNFGLDCHVVGQ